MLTQQQVREHIVLVCYRLGGRRKFCEQNKISEGMLSAVINGKKPPSKKILAAIGIVKEITYRMDF